MIPGFGRTGLGRDQIYPDIIEANLVIYLTHLPLVYFDVSHHWWHQTSWRFVQLRSWTSGGVIIGLCPIKMGFPRKQDQHHSLTWNKVILEQYNFSKSVSIRTFLWPNLYSLNICNKVSLWHVCFSHSRLYINPFTYKSSLLLMVFHWATCRMVLLKWTISKEIGDVHLEMVGTNDLRIWFVCFPTWELDDFPTNLQALSPPWVHQMDPASMQHCGLGPTWTRMWNAIHWFLLKIIEPSP